MNPETFWDKTVWPVLQEYGPKILIFVLVLWAAWVTAAIMRKTTRKALERAKFDATLTRFFANLVRYGILTIAVISLLGIFGIETTSFAAVLAAGGLAIGLAFQSTLSNFAAGVMLLAFRPFKAGDVVNVAGVTAAVEEIELFTTELTTADRRRIIVPNSAIFGSNIENLTHHDTRRVDVKVGTDYGADLDETRRILEAAAPKIAGVLADPAPQVVLLGLGASSVDWQVRVWANTSEYWDVHQATVRAVKQALDAAKIGIPFPQMDVHVDKVA